MERDAKGRFISTVGTIGKWYWHVHHEILAERLTEPLITRIIYIKELKPHRERATRLRLMTPIKNVPERLAKAQERLEVAKKAYDTHALRGFRDNALYYKLVNEYDDASFEYRKIVDDYRMRMELEALHKIEHADIDCPWNGRTIFPKQRP